MVCPGYSSLDLSPPAPVMSPKSRAYFFEPIRVQSASLRPGDVLVQVLNAACADDCTRYPRWGKCKADRDLAPIVVVAGEFHLAPAQPVFLAVVADRPFIETPRVVRRRALGDESIPCDIGQGIIDHTLIAKIQGSHEPIEPSGGNRVCEIVIVSRVCDRARLAVALRTLQRIDNLAALQRRARTRMQMSDIDSVGPQPAQRPLPSEGGGGTR